MSYKPYQMPVDVWDWLKRQAMKRSTPERRVSMNDVLREVVTEAQTSEQTAPTPAAVRE